MTQFLYIKQSTPSPVGEGWGEGKSFSLNKDLFYSEIFPSP